MDEKPQTAGSLPPGYAPPGYANPGGYNGPPQPSWQQPPHPSWQQPPQPSWQQPMPPMQQQQQQQQQTVIIQQAAPTRVVPVAALFGPQPMRTVCPQCDNEIVTVTDHEIGGHAIMWCVILCCLGIDAGCCFIPFCMPSCKDVSHGCPNCGAHLGDWTR